MPWVAQYGRWEFLRDMVGFIELDKVLTIVYLFIYLFAPEVKSLHLSS